MKRIIVVGGSSGMGKSIAIKYAETNNQVFITGRRFELLNQIKQDHPKIETSCFDITEPGLVSHFETIINGLGGLDILILSAGGGEINKEYIFDKEEKMIALNVNAFVKVTHWAFSFFIKQGHGQLAVISSVAAHRGNAVSPSYSASKAFQSTYLEGLAVKAHRSSKPVFVTTTESGFVATKKHNGKVFWLVPVEKAADQIISAIENKRRKVYVSKRWGLIVWFLKRIPFNMYRRI